MSGPLVKNTSGVYKGIDVFKAIAAFMVVYIHACETSDVMARSGMILASIAVPFFFIASGFFFCCGVEKASDKKAYFIKYEKRLILIYFIWAVVIYAPINVTDYVRLNPGASITYLALLLIRRTFVAGASVYWYVLALIISTAIIYFVVYKLKKNQLKILTALITIGIILLFLYEKKEILAGTPVISSINKAFDFIYGCQNNFIMKGIPFCGIGFLIYKKNWNISGRKAVIFFVLSTVLAAGEYYFGNSEQFKSIPIVSIAFIIQAVAYFFIAKNIRFNISDGASKIFRQWSSFVYYTHTIVLYSIQNPILKRLGFPIYEPWFIPFKMLICILFISLIFLIIKKINNKHLNFLING